MSKNTKDFCCVEYTSERGHNEWAVVCSTNKEMWLGAFLLEQDAIRYAVQVNQLARMWHESDS